MNRRLIAGGTAAAAAILSLAGGVTSHVSTARADDVPTVVVAAVGDMACDPANQASIKTAKQLAAKCQQQQVSDLVLQDQSVTAVLGLGDFQYDCGDAADWQVSYNPTWGRLDSEMDPVVGNHEYKTGTDAFGAQCPTTNVTAANYFAHFGAAAHPDTAGHYSFDLGAWHLIGLNANCSAKDVGGCAATSPQTQWLKADLAATTQPCIAAFWHQPLYQGLVKGYVSTYKAWWDALLTAHADLVLNGHIHVYERFAPMDSSSHPSASGITEYVIGTGGEAETNVVNTNPNPQMWMKAFGYMRLSLEPTGWHSEFVTEDGVIHDPWDGSCH